MTHPNQTPKVALVRCDSYDPDELEQSVVHGLDLLGGTDRFFSSGETLLLKPNILIGDNPEKHATTHPAVFGAVGKVLQKAGAKLTYGDSSAFGPPSINAALGGFAATAEKLGIPLADFVHGDTVSFPEGMLIKQFFIAKGVLVADGIICLPKFKTHALMRLTGAVKNLFGCIPGAVKTEFHAILKNEDQFGKMLFDLSRLVSPRLCVMDAIIGMEGNGPRNGTKRKIGLLIFSDDATAMDVVQAHLMVLESRYVPNLAAAELFQQGTLENIELLGEPLEEFEMKDFQVNRKPGTTTLKKGLLDHVLQQWASPRPVIDTDKCVACGICVEMCPVYPKALSFTNAEKNQPPIYDYDLCIRCYCCQETCPYASIYVKTPLLGRIIR